MVEEYIAIMWSPRRGYEVVNIEDLEGASKTQSQALSDAVDAWENHLGYECLLKLSGKIDVSMDAKESLWRKAKDYVSGLDQYIKADETELLSILKSA